VRTGPHTAGTVGLPRIWEGLTHGDPMAAFRNNYSQREIIAALRQKYRKFFANGYRPQIRNIAGFNIGGGTFDIDLALRGPDLEKLAEYGETLKLRARAMGGVADVDSTLQLDKPELRVVIDRARAGDLRVDTEQIATALRHKVGHRFCHGPLVLYAAGHFVEFVNVMVLADLDTLTKELRISSIEETVASANAPVVDVDPFAEYPHQKIDASTRAVRSVWWDYENIIDDPEIEAAFDQAWLKAKSGATLPDHHDLKVAMLAATSLHAPLAERKSIVCRGLLRYLDHLDRLELVKQGLDPWVIPFRLDGDVAENLERF